MRPLGWVLIQFYKGVLIRRGHLVTHRDTRDAHTQREDGVRTEGEGGHLQTKQGGLDRSQPGQHLDLELPGSCERINACCLSLVVCGILFWQLEQTNVDLQRDVQSIHAFNDYSVSWALGGQETQV